MFNFALVEAVFYWAMPARKAKMFTREAKIAGRANASRREVPVVLSTDAPYDRGDYVEILDHTPGNVDLSRAPLPLIEGHDTSKVNIGLVDHLHIEGGKLRGIARFGKSARATEILQDVVDGIIRGVSIGYEQTKLLGQKGREHRFAFKPHEASVVAVPADTIAGFNKAKDIKIMSNANEALERISEADRVKEIVALGETYAKYLKPGEIAEAVRSQMSVDQFRNLIIKNMETGHTDARSSALDLTHREVERYSLARAISAAVTGDWRLAGLERECSLGLQRKLGQTPEGFLVPDQVWRRDFNVGTASEAGNLVATDMRGDLYVDALRNAMVLGRLGVRIIPGLSGNVDIPRKTSPSQLAMYTEIGSAVETAPATAKLSLTPKRISAYIDVSKQALIQSAIALEPMLRDDLLMGAANLLEYQSLNGNGTSPNILGIRNYTTIGSTTAGANGATVAWSHFVDLEAVCANSNAEPSALAGYVSNSKVRAKAKQVHRGTNLDYIIAADGRTTSDGLVTINGYRSIFTNNMPSNLTKGTSTTICSGAIFSSDWSMAVLGLFGAPDVVVDPYSFAVTGQVRITLNQFADFGIRQPAAFSKIDDLLTT